MTETPSAASPVAAWRGGARLERTRAAVRRGSTGRVIRDCSTQAAVASASMPPWRADDASADPVRQGQRRGECPPAWLISGKLPGTGAACAASSARLVRSPRISAACGERGRDNGACERRAWRRLHHRAGRRAGGAWRAGRRRRHRARGRWRKAWPRQKRVAAPESGRAGPAAASSGMSQRMSRRAFTASGGRKSGPLHADSGWVSSCASQARKAAGSLGMNGVLGARMGMTLRGFGDALAGQFGRGRVGHGFIRCQPAMRFGRGRLCSPASRHQSA